MMMMRPSFLALLLSLPLAGAATAASLTPEQAAAFLLVGIQVGQQTSLSGAEFAWEEKSPGQFSGAGTSNGHALQLNVDVVGTAPCVYDFDTRVTIDANPVLNAKATYDFSKITGMTLTGPDTAEIAGSDYCTSDTEGVCTPELSLSVPTDEATFNGVYQDFRAASCK